MKNNLSIINTLLLIGLISYVLFQNFGSTEIQEEIKVQRLSIVGPDGHLYISISNPEKQALATIDGEPISSETNRDLPGIIFFNRIGDELGGIFHDGTENESFAGITFDKQKDDQILAIMKDEYKDGDEWKRWYGLFLRERSDSITQTQMFRDFHEETAGYTEKEREEAYQAMRKLQDEKINVYRMFLGMEENEDVGLFLYDNEGKERIKIYIDEDDHAHFMILDKTGNAIEHLYN